MTEGETECGRGKMTQKAPSILPFALSTLPSASALAVAASALASFTSAFASALLASLASTFGSWWVCNGGGGG